MSGVVELSSTLISPALASSGRMCAWKWHSAGWRVSLSRRSTATSRSRLAGFMRPSGMILIATCSPVQRSVPARTAP